MIGRCGRVLSPVGVLLAAIVLASCTVQQIMIGQWYSIRTPQQAECPMLVWQFAVDAQRTISGSLARAEQPAFASLSGVLNADDSFRMTATNQQDKRTATVTGRFTAQVSTISISGDAAGAGCDGRTVAMRLGSYFARQGGGGGGGG